MISCITSLFCKCSSGAFPPVVSGSGGADRCCCQGRARRVPLAFLCGFGYAHLQIIYPGIHLGVFRPPMTRFALPKNKRRNETANLMTRERRLSLVGSPKKRPIATGLRCHSSHRFSLKVFCDVMRFPPKVLERKGQFLYFVVR